MVKNLMYCSRVCANEFARMQYIKSWLAGEDDGSAPIDGELRSRIRKWLIREADYKCSQCGWNERHPTTGLVPLEIDHIDGDYRNNRPENLRVLCPNCHSLTPTFGSLNTGQGRRKRKMVPLGDL
jgi:RNase P subunit RPR2